MDELIEENMGLVVSIVETFKPKNQTEREDFIDAGRIGLWKALQKHDKDKGVISTYAYQPIRWAIIHEIKNKKNAISLDQICEKSFESKTPIWEYFSSDITEEEQQLIELRCQGYKLHEICDILDKSHIYVKNKFYKLLSKIKEANE